MKPVNYKPIIGLEVHVELRTLSKMFCSCCADHFLVKPNTHTCPVCLGLPGALPVPNKKAIDWCILIGLALNCEIQNTAKFDRKNYFYPDLAKGYQISQYDQPFCRNGFINVDNRKIRINRVHMEEDTGKLIHKGDNTLIDFNRSGVPLVEIVTEPDFDSDTTAVDYLKKIQQIVRYLGVSDCDMEKGSMRLEVNISLSSDKKLPEYKVEVKNINSFKFVAKAIDYEINRQTEILNTGKLPAQETRGFSEKMAKTFSQRSKEEAHDYRYFPEPDIPPFTNLKIIVQKLKSQLPEMPDQKINRFIKEYNVSEYNAKILVNDKKLADYFEKTAKTNEIANLIVNKKIDINSLAPQKILEKVQSKIDKTKLEAVVKTVLSQNLKAVSDYKNGKLQVIGFLIGQVMKALKGQADPEEIGQLIRKLVVFK